MSLQLDSLVTDLIFQATAAIDQKTLIDGLGGQEALEGKQMLDVDRLDPRAEMELSPSMPFPAARRAAADDHRRSGDHAQARSAGGLVDQVGPAAGQGGAGRGLPEA